MEIGNPNLNMNGDVTNRVNVENLDVKSAQANELILRAEKNTKRRWKNGWKKPELLKAGKYYTNAAELFCQNFNSGNIFLANCFPNSTPH